MTKLYRPAIPMRVKLIVVIRQRGMCGCGCGEPLGSIDNTEFDHCPALALRQYDPVTRTYDTPANDPERIIAKIKAHHRDKTSHPRSLGTSIGSDQHLIAKLHKKRVEHFIVRKPPLPKAAPTDLGSPTPQKDIGSVGERPRSRWAPRKTNQRAKPNVRQINEETTP